MGQKGAFNRREWNFPPNGEESKYGKYTQQDKSTTPASTDESQAGEQQWPEDHTERTRKRSSGPWPARGGKGWYPSAWLVTD